MRIISVMSDIALMNMRYFLSPPLYFLPKKAFYSVFSDIPAVALSFPATYAPLFHKGIFALISAYYLLAFVIFLNNQVDF